MTTCPKCNKDDRIQKASSVYSSGVGTGTFAGPATTMNYTDGKVGVGGGYVSGTNYSISETAKKCSPPDKPQKPSTPLKVWFGLLLGVSTICLMSIPSGLGVLGIPPLILVAYLIIKGLSDKEKKDKAYPELQKQYEEELMEWNQLYYCIRDDILFNPETGDIWSFISR